MHQGDLALYFHVWVVRSTASFKYVIERYEPQRQYRTLIPSANLQDRWLHAARILQRGGLKGEGRWLVRLRDIHAVLWRAPALNESCQRTRSTRVDEERDCTRGGKGSRCRHIHRQAGICFVRWKMSLVVSSQRGFEYKVKERGVSRRRQGEPFFLAHLMMSRDGWGIHTLEKVWICWTCSHAWG